MRQSLDARAQKLISETPSDPGQDDPDEPITPPDPGQDDPEEPDDITPKPPEDQHPPKKPEKPGEDDGKKNPYSGPCGSLYAKLYAASQALNDANRAHFEAEQNVRLTEEKIQALKDKFLIAQSDNIKLPGRVKDDTPKNPGQKSKGKFDIAVDFINRGEKYNEYKQKLAKLNAELERFKALQAETKTEMVEAKKDFERASKEWENCINKSRKS